MSEVSEREATVLCSFVGYVCNVQMSQVKQLMNTLTALPPPPRSSIPAAARAGTTPNRTISCNEST